MLARKPRSSDRAGCEESSFINGFPFAPGKMTAETLTNGNGIWNETMTTSSEMEATGGTKSGSRMKNVSRPPPIDIGMARSAVAMGDDDCDSGYLEDRQSEVLSEKTSQEDPGSPQFLSSEESINSPTLTSPTSVASSSDTIDGGILRRKSSIKDVTKTPETPGGKSVRFADALGLDLETVRDILESESPPDYPSMAAAACAAAMGLGSGPTGTPVAAMQPRYLSMSFIQPGGQPDFITRVNQQNVCLENAIVSDFTVLGTIKVQNLSFHKRVKVRYSADGWRSFGDIPASYVQNSCDGPTDRFSFGLTAPRDMAVGARLEFCICYTAGNRQFWDNNFGKNYALVCHSQGDMLDVENTLLWTHFL